MNCQDARESLSMLLDGDIGLTERVPLELHVNTCGECREKLVELQMLRRAPPKSAPRPVHWRPILAAGMVGRALDVIRPDDVATRLRRFVIDRFPPRHLALAAAVPLVLTLAVFVFERGFTIGAAMRQRPPSAAATISSGPPASPAPALPPERLPPTASPAHSTSPPAPAAGAPVAPGPVPPPAAKAQVSDTRVAETKKAVETKGASRSPKAESPAKRETVAPAADSKPATTKSAPVSASAALPPKADGSTAVSASAIPSSPRATVDVVGRLQVKNRSEAERDVAELFTRAGVASVSRRRGPTVTVMEAAVPQAKYGQLAQGLARLGAWRVEAERSPLPEVVQITVRLAE